MIERLWSNPEDLEALMGGAAEALVTPVTQLGRASGAPRCENRPISQPGLWGIRMKTQLE